LFDEDDFPLEKLLGRIFSLEMLELPNGKHSSMPTLGITNCLKQLPKPYLLCGIHNTLFKNIFIVPFALKTHTKFVTPRSQTQLAVTAHGSHYRTSLLPICDI
jgi:hypothetical protein